MDDKILAIRYCIYKVAEDFLVVNSKKVNDLVFFNENNNFSLNKCLLLPFIITIANGKKNQLTNNVFNLSFFPDVDKINGVRIGDIKSNDFEIYSAEALNLNFKNFRLVFEFLENEFADLNVDIKSAIDYSIKFLKERRLEKFSSLSSFELRKISMNNDAFECLLEDIDVKVFVYTNKIELVSQFQKYIIDFPFYLSLVKDLESDVSL